MTTTMESITAQLQRMWMAPTTTVLTASALAVIAAVWLLFSIATRKSKSISKRDPRLAHMPYVDFTDDGDKTMERYAREGTSLMERGYREYNKKGLPFSVFNSTNPSRPFAVLPTKYLEEVRNASASKLSFNAWLNGSQIAADIGAPQVTDRVIHVARQDLNKSLNDLIQPLHQACKKVIPRLIPPSPNPTEEWTTHHGFMLLFQLVSRLMAVVLVGDELWDADEWHGVCNLYFHAGTAAIAQVRDTYPPWLRWTSRFLNKYVMGIRMARKRGQAILRPVIDARVAEVLNHDTTAKNNNKKGGSGDKKSSSSSSRFGDALGWLVESYLSEGGKAAVVDADKIMQDVAFLIAASVPSITGTTLGILLDLVDVDHAGELARIREEISDVYAEHCGGNNGTWTRKALGSLRLLDGFMKESQRVHNLQYNVMQRIALQDYTFKDGLLRIPAGTPIVMPSRLLGLDPDLHRDADRFDPSRWERRRREQGGDGDGDAANKFHFASLHDDMLPWGSGPHACPGRFLAQDIIKLVLVSFVMGYDIKIAGGDGRRPPDTPDHGTSNPNMGAMLLFRER